MTNAIVIDDDFDMVEVFSEFLELRGIRVVGKAHNGLEGLEIYEKNHPDLVFSDVSMPDYDGFYLLSKLKNSHPDSKVIMVTADLTSETEQKLKKFNADAIVFKPFKINKIMDIIKKVSKENLQKTSEVLNIL